MAIPWLIGAAAVAVVGAVVASDSSSSSSSSDDEAETKRRLDREREEKEEKQKALQKISKLEHAVDLLKSSYGVDELEALKLLNPNGNSEHIPKTLMSALESARNDLKSVEKSLKCLEEIEGEF